MSQPNIIFIVLDTLRADKVLNNQDYMTLTPFIKSILGKSIFFENCIANNTWTLPSHITMFTGLHSSQNMLISKKPHSLSNKVPILTEILRDLGYHTICYSENAFISHYYGLTRGFNKVFANWALNPWLKKEYKLSGLMIFLHKIDKWITKIVKSTFLKLILKKIFQKFQTVLKEFVLKFFTSNIIFRLKNDTVIELEKFEEVLKKSTKKKPFYLFFNFLTTHDPYIPLRMFFKRFDIKFQDFRIIKDTILNSLGYRLKISVESIHLPTKKVNAIHKLYDAGVMSGDFIIKKIFSILRDLDLIENSYVIITSDHGEHLGDKCDHYLWLHCTYLNSYEEVIKVPLIIYKSDFKPKIIKNQVQLIDLFNTILHMTGIPASKNQYLKINNSILYQIENNSTPKFIFGEDLKSKGDVSRIVNLYRRSIKKELISKIINSHYFLRSNTHKYFKFVNCNIEEFFNLLTDPHEKDNIRDENDKFYEEMKLELQNILAKIYNYKELEVFLTRKEKNIVDNIIQSIKIKGI